MPPRRSDSPPTRALSFAAAAAAAATALLYVAFIRTATGQRIDDSAWTHVSRETHHAAHRATASLLDTISVSSLALLGIAVMLVAVLRRRPRLALCAGVIVLGANVTTQVIKHLTDRPDLVGGTAAEPTAFPSGHTTVAASLALALVLVVPPAMRWTAALAGGLYALAVGVAVIVLQWHRPSEVVGAYLVSFAWACATGAVLCTRVGSGELGAERRADGRWRRVAGPVAVVLGIGFLAVAALDVHQRLDLVRVADHRTAFAVAAIVCSAVGAALIVAATAMLQTASRRSINPPHG